MHDFYDDDGTEDEKEDFSIAFGGRSAHGIIGFGIGFLVTIPSHVMKIYEE